MIHETVVAEVLAVVAAEDEQRVVEQTAGAQSLDDLTDAVIRVADLRIVESTEQIEVLGRHRDPSGHELEGVLVHAAGPERISGIQVLPHETRRRAIREMGFHVVDEGEERLVERRPALDPALHHAGDPPCPLVDRHHGSAAAAPEGGLETIGRHPDPIVNRRRCGGATVAGVAALLALEGRVAAGLQELPALREDVEPAIVVGRGADPEIRGDAERAISLGAQVLVGHLSPYHTSVIADEGLARNDSKRVLHG